MKKLFVLIALIGLLVNLHSLALAQTSYSASASIPTGSITMSLFEVKVDTDPTPDESVWTSASSVSFGTLGLNTDDIFMPVAGGVYDQLYYVVTIANSGAFSTTATVQVTYADGTKPQAEGLGNRATSSFTKWVYVDGTNDTETSIGVKKALIDSNSVSAADFAGGSPRVYLGIHDGAVTITNAEPFTQADLAGTYNGTVTISVTG